MGAGATASAPRSEEDEPEDFAEEDSGLQAEISPVPSYYRDQVQDQCCQPAPLLHQLWAILQGSGAALIQLLVAWQDFHPTMGTLFRHLTGVVGRFSEKHLTWLPYRWPKAWEQREVVKL